MVSETTAASAAPVLPDAGYVRTGELRSGTMVARLVMTNPRVAQAVQGYLDDYRAETESDVHTSTRTTSIGAW